MTNYPVTPYIEAEIAKLDTPEKLRKGAQTLSHIARHQYHADDRFRLHGRSFELLRQAQKLEG